MASQVKIQDKVQNSAIPICLPITTRGIGFATAACLKLIEKEGNLKPPPDFIYKLYAASLGMLQAKIQDAIPSSISTYIWEKDFRQYYTAAHFKNSDLQLPDILTCIINSVGVLRLGNKEFYPNSLADKCESGLFRPFSEQVTFSNISEVVLSLNNPKTPLKYRQEFYNNNSLPGTKWQIDTEIGPTLKNIDSYRVLGGNYWYHTENWGNDLIKVMADWKKQSPEYFTQLITWNTPGNKSMLVCNKQSGMRITERNAIDGNICEYYNLEPLSFTEEQINGNFALLGETSVFEEHTYLWRDLRNCTEYSDGISYKQALSKKMQKQ